MYHHVPVVSQDIYTLASHVSHFAVCCPLCRHVHVLIVSLGLVIVLFRYAHHLCLEMHCSQLGRRRPTRSYPLTWSLIDDVYEFRCLAPGMSQTATMFAVAGALEQKLEEFVSTEPVDWKFYVQVFTWSVCLFESYLL